MAKRKSTRKAVKKVKVKLEKTFKCLFCNAPKSVGVRLFVLPLLISRDQVNKIGFLSCKSCPSTFETSINILSEAIDVYSEWVDQMNHAPVSSENPIPRHDDRIQSALEDSDEDFD